MIESSIVIIGNEIVDYSKGSAAKVEFNWDNIWEGFKKSGKEEVPWFIHVHPKGYNTFSPLDLNCMQGFYAALGETIYFTIVIFDNNDIYDLSHSQYDFMYGMDKIDPNVEEVRGLLGTLVKGQLALLKSLSIGE